jgi:hypothetical protein
VPDFVGGQLAGVFDGGGGEMGRVRKASAISVTGMRLRLLATLATTIYYYFIYAKVM